MIALFIALSAVGIYSLEREPVEEALDPALPPIHEIVPTGEKPLVSKPEAPAKPSATKMPAIPKTQAVQNGAILSKRIAFTFDDGPHPGYTERLLQILGDNGVRATFFIVGKQAALHPNLIEKIFQAGHELANHSYTHRDLRKLAVPEVAEELDKTHRLIESITDQKMRFFRPPGGQYDERVIEQASDLNYTMALWTVLPQDHLNPASNVIVERVMRSAEDHSIVLMHSGIENTLAALPQIISNLKEKGYEFVALSDIGLGAASRSLVKLARK